MVSYVQYDYRETSLTEFRNPVFLQRPRLLSGTLDLDEENFALLEHHEVREARLVAQTYLHGYISVPLVSADNVSLNLALQPALLPHRSLSLRLEK